MRLGPSPWAGVGVASDLKTMPSSLRLGVSWGLPFLGSLGLHPDTTPIPRSHCHPGASLLSRSPSWSFLPTPKPSQQPSTDLTLSPLAQSLSWLPTDLRTKPSSSPWPMRSEKAWPVLLGISFQPKVPGPGQVPPLGRHCLPHLTVSPGRVGAWLSCH